MNNKIPIIHAGFPKCASTFLQKEVFPKLDYEIKNSFDYVELATKYLDDITDKKVLNLFNETNYILSLETFLHLDAPLKFKKYGEKMTKDIFLHNINKFKGKILIIIRRQDDLINSWIKYYTAYSNGEHFFIDYPIFGKNQKSAYLKNKYGITFTHTFDYYDIVSRIESDKLYILIYEDLKYNPKKFFKELGDCVEEDLSNFDSTTRVNVTKFNPETKKLFPSSQFIQNIIRKLPIPKLIKKSIKKLFIKENISPAFKEEIMELYKDSNKRLAEKYKLEIKKYNYY